LILKCSPLSGMSFGIRWGELGSSGARDGRPLTLPTLRRASRRRNARSKNRHRANNSVQFHFPFPTNDFRIRCKSLHV